MRSDLYFVISTGFLVIVSAQGDAPLWSNKQPYLFQISENTPGKVGKLSANQTSFNTTCVLDSRGNRILTIDNSSPTVATLTLKDELDREEQEFYNFTVTLKYNNLGRTKQATRNFTLQVLDVNDNKPFAHDSVINVGCYETGKEITRIRAYDKDKGDNGTILYNITSVNDMVRLNHHQFEANSRGEIIVRRKLRANYSYNINVTIQDGGSPPLRTHVSIKVNIVPIVMLYVQQWSTKGYNISNIHKYMENCSINMTIKEAEERAIIADQSVGWIRVNRLVREELGTKFCLVVKIACPGTKYRLSVFNITVKNTTEAPFLASILLKWSFLIRLRPFSPSDLREFENKVDSCIALPKGGSRVIKSFPRNRGTSQNITLLRTYYSQVDYRTIDDEATKQCIRGGVPGGWNLSVQVNKKENPQTTQMTMTPASSYPTSWTRISRGSPSNSVAATPTISTKKTTTAVPITAATNNKPQPTKTERSEVWPWAFGVIMVILVGLVGVHFYCRKRRRRLADGDMEMTQITDATKPPWLEIDKGFIATGKELGSGYFGVVFEGTVIMDADATETDSRDLLNELKIIARIGNHPNIINLIGACTKSGKLKLKNSNSSSSSLSSSSSRRHREETYTNINSVRPDIKLDYKQRLKIAYEVARGMRHLSSKKCVHRDLAARNILLDEHYVAKVTDFGLSRDVYEAGVYQINAQSKVPLKWMAIESLESMTFTTQSDVWSFAVLVWEIETGGATPYPGMLGREIFQEIIAGHRLEQPSTCPNELYELMSTCWIREPSCRPSFQGLVTELESFLQTEAGYEELTMEMDNTARTQL